MAKSGLKLRLAEVRYFRGTTQEDVNRRWRELLHCQPQDLLRLCPEVEDQRLWLLRLETDLHLSLYRLLSLGGNREKELIVDRTEMRFPKLG